MTTVEILFWLCALLVFYTYLGYGILLWGLVKLKEAFCKRKKSAPATTELWPEVTLLIAAYNEEDVVDDKMENCRALIYPEGRLRIAWVTDGSNDGTVAKLAGWPGVTVYHEAPRRGKTAALNRAVPLVTTPITVLTDANAMLNPEAVREIVRCFADPKVGCVAGEKRVASSGDGSAASAEGIYWKYESALKELDSRLHSVVGAAGELFAVRTALFRPMPEDTLLDDFILSMRIAAEGHRTAYCRAAYTIESTSADMAEEEKRKKRIAAGGLQAIWRLRPLLNIFRYGTLSFQYISHRVLRWTLTPVALFALLPLNIVLLWSSCPVFYGTLLGLQILFYAAGFAGHRLAQKQIKSKLLYVPYYFLFMNLNVWKGIGYLRSHRGTGVWEKARRAG